MNPNSLKTAKWIISDELEHHLAAAPLWAFMKKNKLNNSQDLNFMGWKFLQESSKKVTHLFNAHMPQLPQIARSTVLHMQICFAWKSIWSCLKESRTALLLSPPTTPPPPSPALLSRGKHFHQLHSRGQAVSGTGSPRLARTPPSTTVGPICRFSWALSVSRTRDPRKLFVHVDNTCSAGTLGIIIQSVIFSLC